MNTVFFERRDCILKHALLVALLAVFSSFDQENGILILKVTESQLTSVPEFHDSDLNDPAFAERVYQFFGLAPSWSEKGKGEEKSM